VTSVLVLGGMLIFSGLLFAGFAPIAHLRLKRSVAWSDAVAGLARSPIAPARKAGTLVAIRGRVKASTPLEDPVTAHAVVWYECEVRVGDEPAEMDHDETAFVVEDESGSVRIDPANAREVAVQVDVFEPGDDRDQVGPFLTRRGLGNRADVGLEHRQIKIGDELVVVGRWCDSQEHGATLSAGDDAELVLTTHSLEAFQEREVASAKSGALGVVILSVLGFGCTALGVAFLAMGW